MQFVKSPLTQPVRFFQILLLISFVVSASCSRDASEINQAEIKPDPARMERLKDHYGFTSIEGATFYGKLLLVESERVTIQRHSDGKEFTIPKDRFIDIDRDYFEDWARRNRHLNVPGRNVDRISLRCSPIDSNSSSSSLRSFASVSYNPSTSVWTAQAGTRRSTSVNKTKSVVLRVEGSSITGPVLTRIHTLFFAKPKGGTLSVSVHSTEDVLVDRSKGELIVSSGRVHGFYGYGAVAINLVTGKVMAIDASRHLIRDYLEAQVDNDKFLIKN